MLEKVGNPLTILKFKKEFVSCVFYQEETLEQNLFHKEKLLLICYYLLSLMMVQLK